MPETPHHKRAAPLRCLTLLACAAALVMALLPNPPALPADPSDKLVHTATFATLALLTAQGWPRTGFWPILLALATFGGAIELLQGLPPIHRDVSFADWLVDIAGVSAGLLLLAPTGRWTRQSRPGTHPSTKSHR